MQSEATIRPEVGDAVIAADGRLGRIERIVRSEARTPVYMIVSVGGSVRRRYPVIPCTLVEAVDRRRRRVRILGPCRALGRLPETLPLVL